MICVDDSDIPDDPDEALKSNALKLSSIEGKRQIGDILDFLEDITKTALDSLVLGEELRTHATEGVKMIISKYI